MDTPPEKPAAGGDPAQGPGSTGPGGDKGGGGWPWWLKYFWLVPIVLLLMILLGAIIDLLEALGLLRELRSLLKWLWEALREFWGSRPRPSPPPETPSPPDTPEEPGEEPPEEDDDHKDGASCTLVGEPSIELDPRGWVIVVPDCEPGAIHLAHGFSMTAHFGGDCRCCEYRQEIMGYFSVKRRGSDYWEDIVTPIGGGAQLRRDIFQEDGKPFFRYGHRKGQRNIFEDSYLQDRSDGCEYVGSDLPGIRGLRLGDQVAIHLTFRGSVIDVCTNETKWQKMWELRTHGHIDLDMSFPYLDSTYVYKKLF